MPRKFLEEARDYKTKVDTIEIRDYTDYSARTCPAAKINDWSLADFLLWDTPTATKSMWNSRQNYFHTRADPNREPSMTTRPDLFNGSEGEKTKEYVRLCKASAEGIQARIEILKSFVGQGAVVSRVDLAIDSTHETFEEAGKKYLFLMLMFKGCIGGKIAKAERGKCKTIGYRDLATDKATGYTVASRDSNGKRYEVCVYDKSTEAPFESVSIRLEMRDCQAQGKTVNEECAYWVKVLEGLVDSYADAVLAEQATRIAELYKPHESKGTLSEHLRKHSAYIFTRSQLTMIFAKLGYARPSAKCADFIKRNPQIELVEKTYMNEFIMALINSIKKFQSAPPSINSTEFIF